MSDQASSRQPRREQAHEGTREQAREPRELPTQASLPTGTGTGTGASARSARSDHGAQSAPARRGVTAGTTAAALGHADEAKASGRRGVVLGLLTAGAAVVAGSVASAVRGGGLAGLSAGTGAAGTGSGVTPTGRIVRARLTVEGMRFVPDTLSVAPGDRLLITLDNTADQVHDLVLATGQSTGRVAAGASAELDAGIIAGPVEGWCSIAGHRAQGMVMHVTTSAAGSEADGTNPSGHQHQATTGTSEVQDQAAASSSAAVPDYQAPLPGGFTPWDAALAPAPAESVHRVTFTVTEVEGAYVGGGVTQTRWTYNGAAPGPVLRGKVGDTFEVTLVNNGTMSHSIDFHAGIVSPDEVMRSINPGESLTYRFTAEHSGIWLYHCSTTPMSVHLASGMHGAVIIDPDGLSEVDREYLLIQSELYLGPEGGETDAAKVAAKTPDLMAFNGVAFQYALAPLEARTGERVRFWVLDAGPSLPSSFHVVGLQFDTVFHEGTYLLGGPDQIGAAWHGGSQALGLMPAQGGFVEAVVPAAGHYSVVTHAFADMEKGAKAVLEAAG